MKITTERFAGIEESVSSHVGQEVIVHISPCGSVFVYHNGRRVYEHFP